MRKNKFSFIAVALVMLALMVALPAKAQTATYTTWGSSGIGGAQTNLTNPVYSVTVASSALTNLFGSIPDRGLYRKCLVSFDGTLYLNGTLATPTLGVAIASTSSPMTFDLPTTPSLSGLVVTAVGTNSVAVKLVPIR